MSRAMVMLSVRIQMDHIVVCVALVTVETENIVRISTNVLYKYTNAIRMLLALTPRGLTAANVMQDTREMVANVSILTSVQQTDTIAIETQIAKTFLEASVVPVS